jgi:hypothetical protein
MHDAWTYLLVSQARRDAETLANKECVMGLTKYSHFPQVLLLSTLSYLWQHCHFELEVF